VFAASPEWLAANEELAKAWVKTHLDVYADVYANPSLLVEKAKELLPEIDQAALPEIVDAFIEAEIWPVDGGLQPDAVQATIDFFNADGKPFRNITSPADVVDRSILDSVLAERE
jgi:ABC-type nitrate/sulfonate/bicarbonate transport system substrate-binding protein